ncbi:MAG: ABC transporter ATP-binding protein, partial [Actinomycetota bacterium]
MTTATSFELEGIERSFGSFALNVEKICFAPGQITCLVGPSGSGKTTLLHIAGLLEAPDAGTVRMNGDRVDKRSSKARRQIATVLQKPFMFPVKVIQQVAYPLRIRGMNARDAQAKALRTMQIYNVAHLADRAATKLSGGEARRVALAAAIACEPKVLLLDEPLSNIDEPMRNEISESLKSFTRETGCTTVWVTHDRSETLSVADEIAVLIEGRLVQAGPPAEVLSQPEDARAARFLGSGNLIAGTVVSNPSGIASVDCGDGLMLEAMGQRQQGDRVWIVVRPEDVGVSIQESSQVSP